VPRLKSGPASERRMQSELYQVLAHVQAPAASALSALESRDITLTHSLGASMRA
jgi:hypothetical protein